MGRVGSALIHGLRRGFSYAGPRLEEFFALSLIFVSNFRRNLILAYGAAAN